MRDIKKQNNAAPQLAAQLPSANEQGSLDRNGEINSTSLIYNWDQGKGQLMSLLVTYLEHDLDGEAMSFDGYSLQFNNVTAFTPDLSLATNVVLDRFDHDAENPVYDKTNDKDLAALSLTLFLNDPFGAKNWVGNLAIVYAEEDNSIDFYDTTVSLINLGMIRRF
jgi:hypothetical protein